MSSPTSSAAAAAAAPSPPASPPPEAVIRFTNGLADLQLPLASPATSTVAGLLAAVRHERPSTARRRLRLIHAGKVLAPQALLASIQRPGKGKAPAERLWIHCSVGDELTDAELAAEATAQPAAPAPPTTLPQPQGFDRLLSAGFTAAEVAALRSQFNRLNPTVSAEDMRMVEERWIDESAGGGAGAGAGGEDGGYEDMWIGTMIGFFWPPAVLLLKEDGICSKRRAMAIVGGLLVNILFGLIRLSA